MHISTWEIAGIPKCQRKSHLVWLPISMRSGYPIVKWYDQWDLSVFDNMYRYKRAESIINGNIYSLLEKNIRSFDFKTC